MGLNSTFVTRHGRGCLPLALCLAAMANSSSAQEAKNVAPAPKTTPSQSFVSTHTVTVNGQQVRYEVRAETTILTNVKDEPAASLFAFSYLRQDVKDSAARPVIFIFNGGPGSSSVWLHMSGLAPRRIDLGKVPNVNTVPPFNIVDSDFSVIDVADLVFIDPVGTGFSRLLPGGRDADFHGLMQDARSIVDFIRIWSTTHRRWNSPKYLLGESYGTHRIAAMMNVIDNGTMNVPINGIILLGQALDMTSTNPDPGNDMSCVLILPSMAAAAWHYGKVDKAGKTFSEFLESTRHFAETDYAAALFAGSRLGEQDRSRIAHQLAAFTGLKEPVLLKWGLRVTRAQFVKSLLSDENEVLASDDARFAETLPEGNIDPTAIDPFLDRWAPGLTSAFRAYLQSDLGVTTEQSYNVFAQGISLPRWDWDTGAGGTSRFYFNVTPMIARAMRQNPKLRLMIGTGYYDLLTPFFSAEHTVTHSGIPLDRVQIKYYESGHMPYVGDTSAKQFASDVRNFVKEGQ